MYSLFSSCAFFFIASIPLHLLDIASYVLCLNWLLGGTRQGWGNTIIIVKVKKKCPLEEGRDFCGHQMEKIDNLFHIAKRSSMSSNHINMSL